MSEEPITSIVATIYGVDEVVARIQIGVTVPQPVLSIPVLVLQQIIKNTLHLCNVVLLVSLCIELTYLSLDLLIYNGLTRVGSGSGT